MTKGARGEERAAAYLVEQGYSIVGRNVRSRWGEIDIVASRGTDLAFVEVKTWDALGKECLERSIGAPKQRRIRKTAEWFLLANRELGALRPRFDVLFLKGEPVSVEDHIEGAF
jgi:putative endonuclease